MFVYLKESEQNRKLHINKNFKNGLVKLIFDKDNPVHEINEKSLVDFLMKSFPNFLEKSKDAPNFKKKAKPEPKIEKKEEQKEVKVEEPVEVPAEPEPEKEPESNIITDSLDKKEEVTTPSQILSDLLQKKKESE